MMRITGILLATATIMMSCQQTQFPTEIASLEKLILSVDTAKTTLAAIDTNGYAQHRKDYVHNLGFVEQYFKARGDTIDRDLAFFLTDYRVLKKPYRDFKSKYEQAGKDLIFTEKQLLTLKHDLEHNALEPALVSKFVQSETQATNKIVGTVKRLALTHSATREKGRTLEMKMDSVMTLLKNN